MKPKHSLHNDDFSSKAQAMANTQVVRHYGESLVALAKHDQRIVCLTADLSAPTESDLFRDELPERFYNLGIAEANMIGMASGMARMGDIPFVHSFAVFVSRRVYDQVAMQVAYPQTNVKIVGFLPGLTTNLGVSHQAIDDIALMRALPNMTVVEPKAPEQTAAAVKAIAAYEGPVYMRMRRIKTPLAEHQQPMPFELGNGQVLREGNDAVIFASGMMLDEAQQAADMLARQDVHISIVNIHTIKPLDETIILEYARCGRVLSAENHSIIGGLGEAIASLLLERGVQVKFKRLGVQDTFAEGGSTGYLFERYGLNARYLVQAVMSLMAS